MNKDIISPDEIKKDLRTTVIGKEIIYEEKTASTNKIAEILIERGTPNGTLIIADEQTLGRGRLNRSWISPPFENVLMSVILETSLSNQGIFYLTMIASVAVVNAIKKVTGLSSFIKWPNDIYIKNKKTAGILTEIREKNNIRYAIIGIGLNVNSDISSFTGLERDATSLLMESGKHISRNHLLRKISEEIDSGYAELSRNELNVIRNEWEKHSLIIGKEVIILSGKTAETGIAESLSDDGSLVLLKENGMKKNIYAGDVSLRIKG